MLRDLTRARTAIAQSHTKRDRAASSTLLENAGIKLSSVACEITGVSGRAMLEALIGLTPIQPAMLADLAKQQLRKKIPALTAALPGGSTTTTRSWCGCICDGTLDAHESGSNVSAAVEEAITPFSTRPTPERERRKLHAQVVADVFIAEPGADMNVFPTTKPSSWAGSRPRQRQISQPMK